MENKEWYNIKNLGEGGTEIKISLTKEETKLVKRIATRLSKSKKKENYHPSLIISKIADKTGGKGK